MPNSEVAETIDFRPHRVREGDLALWWQLDETAGSLAVDSAGGDSNGTGSPIWFAPGKFGASGIEFDGTDGKALLSTGVSGDFESATLSLWVYPESPDFHLFSLEGNFSLHVPFLAQAKASFYLGRVGSAVFARYFRG